jgi:hypothetical protein
MERWNLILTLYILFLWLIGAFKSIWSLLKSMFFTAMFFTTIIAGSYAYEGKNLLAFCIFVSPLIIAFLFIKLIPSSELCKF